MAMNKQYKKPYETTQLDAFEQAMAARRYQKATHELLQEKEAKTTFAPDGLISELLKRLGAK